MLEQALTVPSHLTRLRLPRCEAVRKAVYLSDTDKSDKRCTHSAMYVLDGKNYCGRHAGSIALMFLLKEPQTNDPIPHVQV